MTRKTRTNPNENLYLALGIMYVMLFVAVMLGLAYESSEQSVAGMLILLSIAVLGISVYYIATCKHAQRKADTPENSFPNEGSRNEPKGGS